MIGGIPAMPPTNPVNKLGWRICSVEAELEDDVSESVLVVVDEHLVDARWDRRENSWARWRAQASGSTFKMKVTLLGLS